MATKPKSTTQKASAASQIEMKKNVLLRPPKPTGDRAADKKAAKQFIDDSRQQKADRAAADKAAIVKQQQLDYTIANPLQGTRPATAAARAQVAASRGSPNLTYNLQQVGDPMKRVSQAYQNPTQKDNLKKAQEAEAARIAALPKKPVYTGPQGSPKPKPKPGQQTPEQIANYKKIIDRQSGATGIPKAVAPPLPPGPGNTPNVDIRKLFVRGPGIFGGDPSNGNGPGTMLPPQPQPIDVPARMTGIGNNVSMPGLTIPLQPRTDGYQPTSTTPYSADFIQAAYENNQRLAQAQPPSLATLQPGTMTASTPAIQNTIAPGYQTATPGATGIYALPAAAGQLTQSGQGGIYDQPGQPGTTQYPLNVGPLGGSSGTFSGYQPGQPFMTNGFQPMLSTGNQPYSINQTYGQTQSPNSGTQTAPGIDPNFNTNSSQPTGQLPQNAPNFGQQQQTTQQANPIKIQLENPTPDATMGSGSGKFGGSGSPMGTINTSAL